MQDVGMLDEEIQMKHREYAWTSQPMRVPDAALG